MFKHISSILKKGYSNTLETVTRRPVAGFFILLLVLFGLIALGHYMRTPKDTGERTAAEKKETAVFIPHTDTARLKVPAQVKKENVIQIVALSPGIVSHIYTSVGRTVSAGQTLFNTTADYGSGRALIEKNIATNNAKLTEDLAKIDKRIFQLEEKRIKNNSLLSSTEEDVELARLKKDRATRQNTLTNNPLELQAARLSDAVLKPRSFAVGTVESIRVRTGDFVSTGTVLATIRAPRGATTLEALVSRKTALLFDPTKEAILRLEDETLNLLPTYFSQEETVNGLYSILFTLSDSARSKIVNGEYLSIELPLRASNPEDTLIPIDAIFQENDSASVLVEENGKAVSKEVTLGNIYGSFALITSGIARDARVILSRAVIASDEITVR